MMRVPGSCIGSGQEVKLLVTAEHRRRDCRRKKSCVLMHMDQQHIDACDKEGTQMNFSLSDISVDQYFLTTRLETLHYKLEHYSNCNCLNMDAMTIKLSILELCGNYIKMGKM